jgi:hypothetical protein
MSKYTHIEIVTPSNTKQVIENTAKNLDWVKMAFDHGWIVSWEKIK